MLYRRITSLLPIRVFPPARFLQTPPLDPPTSDGKQQRPPSSSSSSSSSASPSSATAFRHPRVNVLYEDNHVIVVNKPAGLLSQGDLKGHPDQLSLTRRHIEQKTKKRKAYLGLVHRLDRNVSGVMLFAKTSKAAARISEELQSRQVTKIYMAVVLGELRGKDVLQNKVLSTGANLMRVANDRDSPSRLSKAQEAILHYEALSIHHHPVGGPHTLVKIQLITGRKHQIRTQLSHLGYPICGDVKYGAPRPFRDKSIALHCREVTFTHPTKKDEREQKTMMTVSAPLPWNWGARFGPEVVGRGEVEGSPTLPSIPPSLSSSARAAVAGGAAVGAEAAIEPASFEKEEKGEGGRFPINGLEEEDIGGIVGERGGEEQEKEEEEDEVLKSAIAV